MTVITVGSMAGASQRVVLHVGTPKSGTSFIQGTLAANAERLREEGVLFASRQRGSGHRAASEMRERYGRVKRAPQELAGSWDLLCQRARNFPGTSVISNEVLGGASRKQAHLMLAGLTGLDVHVAVTARDLARTFPATWQQSAKHGLQRGFAKHEQMVVEGAREREEATYFWHQHDLPSVLARWGDTLPAGHVHVITVPPVGQPVDVLWQRFCEVLGVRAEMYPTALDNANVSLGTIEVEVLHRVSRVAQERDKNRQLARFVNRYYVREILRRYESPRAGTPERLMPLFEDVANQWISAIESRGYDVVGDLADLIPRPSTSAAADPDDVPPAVALDRAASTIVDLLEEIRRLRAELATSTQEPEGGQHLLASLVRRTNKSRSTRTRSTS